MKYPPVCGKMTVVEDESKDKCNVPYRITLWPPVFFSFFYFLIRAGQFVSLGVFLVESHSFSACTEGWRNFWGWRGSFLSLVHDRLDFDALGQNGILVQPGTDRAWEQKNWVLWRIWRILS